MFKLRALTIVFSFFVVSSVVSAWLPAVVFDQSGRPSTTNPEIGQESKPPVTIGDAIRTIRALEARSLKQHQQLLEDTQALADVYNSLVEQNADRIAEIAHLKKEVESIRVEIAALKAQRLPSRLAHSPD
jgi:hypothetical protein